MKKDSLLKMKDLPATEEMLAVAREDVPVKVGSGWNTFYRCRYSGFVRSSVEGGILKVTLYDPDAMRLGGTLPVYEIFMEKEKQQFLTYDRTRNEWRAAKIDYLEWQAKGSNNVWISAVDDAQIRQYLASDEKSVYRAILKFQRAVRDAELERRHRKETDPWDAELSQTPPLPKDWERWVNKVGIQENYIFYDYRKGGARYGYCTYCEKEVALKQRPYHNAVGKCPRCRHKITFKAKGKITEYLRSPTECAYLAQKCGDGFVVRQFHVNRQYRKEENTIVACVLSYLLSVCYVFVMSLIIFWLNLRISKVLSYLAAVLVHVAGYILTIGFLTDSYRKFSLLANSLLMYHNINGSEVETAYLALPQSFLVYAAVAVMLFLLILHAIHSYDFRITVGTKQ